MWRKKKKRAKERRRDKERVCVCVYVLKVGDPKFDPNYGVPNIYAQGRKKKKKKT